MALKRIISILLCAMMIFGSFSVVAAEDAAVDTEIAEVEQEVKINPDFAAMRAIGVFSSDLVSGATLTRRQLAETFVNIIIPDQADDEYIATAVYFDDIIESDFDINLVYEMGIMGGAGDNKFLPDKEVTYAEFIKALVNFLGYKLQAENYGGFPTGYQIMAINFGFSKYGPADINMLCTTDMVAAILREAMNVPVNHILYRTGEGDPVFLKQDVNYLELYTKTYVDEGIITGTYVEDMYTQNGTGYFDVRIDNEPFVLSDVVLYLNEMLGNKITYFYKYDRYNNKEVIYAEQLPIDILELSRMQIDDKNTTTDRIYYFNENGKQKKIDISKASIFYNGKLCVSYDVNDINPFANENIDGYIRCVNIDGKEGAEYVFIEAFNTYTVSAVENGEIVNEFQPEIVFTTDEFDENEIILKNVIGEMIRASEIKKGNVLNVFRNQAGRVVKAILTVDSYLGTIDKIERSDDEIVSITVNGFTFKPAANLLYNNEYNALKAGKKVQITFNHLGDIADVIVDAFDSNTYYGYIVDAAHVGAIDGVVHIRMLTAKNTMDAIPLKETVILNKTQKKTAEQILDMLGAPVERQVCQYVLNNNGEICELMFVDETLNPETDDGFYKFDNSLWSSEGTYYVASEYSFWGKLLLKPSLVLFIVPEESQRYNEDMYMATDVSFLKSESQESDYFPKDKTNIEKTLGFADVFSAFGHTAGSPVATVATIEIGSENYISRYQEKVPLVLTDKTTEYIDGEYKHTITGYVGTTLSTYNITHEAFHGNTGTGTNTP